MQILRLASHTGTHLDSPRHVIPDGLVITDFSPDELIFTRPVVIDLRLSDAAIVSPLDLEPFSPELAEANIALFRFGYGAVRSGEPRRFSSQCPGFGIESGRWLRKVALNLRAMGMDVPSVACIAHLDQTMAVHHELLGGPGRRFLIIQEMHLDHDLTGLHQVRVCPWRVRDMDSGPCSVVGCLSV